MSVSHMSIIGIVFLVFLVSCAAKVAHEPVEYEPIQYEFETNYADIGGIRICYTDQGSGDPVMVFVHGLAGNMGIFSEPIRRFSKTHRMLALDLPGHGNSERRDDIPYGIPLFADTVKGLLDRLGIEKAVVAGVSMGGHTTCYFSWKYPDRCAGAVLIDAAGIDANFPPFSKYFLEHHSRWMADKMTSMTRKNMAKGKQGIVNKLTLKSGKDGAKWPRFWDTSKTNVKKWIENDQRYMNRFVWTDEYPKWNYALVRCTLGIIEAPMTDKLSEIKVPTLIVWGEHDGLVSIKNAYIFANGIPSSFLTIIDDCGHVPPLEEPEAFISALARFLETLQ